MATKLTEKEQEQIWKFTKNILIFTAPALSAFFITLSNGATFKQAWPILLFTLYGLTADYLKKIK